MRAEDAQGTPTQRHTSPSILVYEEDKFHIRFGLALEPFRATFWGFSGLLLLLRREREREGETKNTGYESLDLNGGGVTSPTYYEQNTTDYELYTSPTGHSRLRALRHRRGRVEVEKSGRAGGQGERPYKYVSMNL